MPEVTVEFRPYGEPIATTDWPTWRSDDLPIVAGVRPDTPSALITAMSVTGSVPTTVALAVVPSLKFTVMLPLSPATEATWLLVRMLPSADRMMPEPEPEPDEPVTLILTTEGSTVAATFSTDPDGAAAALDALTGPDDVEVVTVSSPCRPSYSAAPPTPADPPTRRAPASTAAVNPPGRRTDAVVLAVTEGGCWNGGSGRV